MPHVTSGRAGWLVAAVLALFVIAAVTGVARGGPLDPPGTPGPTRPQAEPRVPIGQAPFVISQPGSYYLTGNLTVSAGSAITIDAENVTLDLNGFTISGSGLFGIETSSGTKTNITVRNGSVVGFSSGIVMVEATRSTFEDLTVTGSADQGILVGGGSILRRLNVFENGADGVFIDVNGNNYGAILEDSDISRNASNGVAIYADNVWVHDCVIDANAGAGIMVNGGYNKITDNRITRNLNRGVILSGNPSDQFNVVGHNLIAANTAGVGPFSVQDMGLGNRVPPEVTDPALTTSNPWANIVY
ncbi:MAG TPA: right-handed parallel beta-helix repeat-containing protein [Dehalococcoidia bacterium]|nr:right-handed parallel beta-helix repeat-containing protein [Dehalococcoidia bacterium]